MSDKSILETVELLLEKNRTVPELEKLTGKKNTVLYKHMRVLMEMGLVEKFDGIRIPGKNGRASAVFQLTHKPRRVPEAAVDEVMRYADEYRMVNGPIIGAAAVARETLRNKIISLYEDT